MKPELLQSCLAKTQILSADWLSECLKSKTLKDTADYIVPVTYPQRLSSFKSEEEESKDTVVKLEDIIGDIYSLKFGKHAGKAEKSKKRPFEEDNPS